MRSLPYWRKILRFQQRSGWCGPAVVQMALASGGIRKPQAKIAYDVYHPWWGTTQHSMLAYFSKFFKKYSFKENASISDVERHLERGHTIIVNWMDDLTPDDEEGHYSLIIRVDRGRKTLTLADPGGRRGIWSLKIGDFEKKWYDYLDFNEKLKITHWFLWLDPKSKI